MTGALPALCLTLVLLAALLTAALCAACKRGNQLAQYVPPPLTPERQAAEFEQIRRHWCDTAPDPQEKP